MKETNWGGGEDDGFGKGEAGVDVHKFHRLKTRISGQIAPQAAAESGFVVDKLQVFVRLSMKEIEVLKGENRTILPTFNEWKWEYGMWEYIRAR